MDEHRFKKPAELPSSLAEPNPSLTNFLTPRRLELLEMRARGSPLPQTPSHVSTSSSPDEVTTIVHHKSETGEGLGSDSNELPGEHSVSFI
jgi:hypothetical protein